MNKSIVFLILTIFISSGFVSYSNFADKEAEKKQKFLEYLSYFEKVSLPYKLDLQTIECFDFTNTKRKKHTKISAKDDKFYKVAQAFYAQLRKEHSAPFFLGRFSRMGRPIIEPMARFYPDDETVAVIYKSSMQFANPIMTDYYLSYYDLKGNPVGRSKKNLSSASDQRIGFTNLHHTQVFTIFPSGKIETVFYDNHWKAKVGSIAIEKNELLGFKKVKEINYQLDSRQGIQEIAQVNARP